jgi:putative transposase
VNAKRVYRLYREMGLQIRHKTPKRRVKAKLREDRRPATRSNETWAMDFVHDQLATGAKLRVLTIVDTFSRFSPAIEPRFNFHGADVVDVLERVGREVGFPAAIRVDQGSEFVSRDLDLWAYQRGVTLDFSRPGKPTDNAFIESFNGKFRAECLNAHWFMSLDDARRKCEAWRRDYNEERAHRSATKSRSSSSTDQRHSARPDRATLEKAQHGGPRIGSGSIERQAPIAAG